MSITVDPAHEALAQAKEEVIDSARAIDPLAPLRRRPLVWIGVAGGLGLVMGWSRWGRAATVNLARACYSLVRMVGPVYGAHVVRRADDTALQAREPCRE